MTADALRAYDPITVVQSTSTGQRLLHALVVHNADHSAVFYAISRHVSAPVYRTSLQQEGIKWCRGHLSREDAKPLLAAAALADII